MSCSKIATRGRFCEDHYWQHYNGPKINIPGRYLKDSQIKFVEMELAKKIKECGQLASQIEDYERATRGAARMSTWRICRSLSAVLKRIRE